MAWKQIDGLNEDEWFEQRAADILHAWVLQGAPYDRPLGAFIADAQVRYAPAISASVDEFTADTSFSIWSVLIDAALREAKGNTLLAIQYLKGDRD